MKRISLQWRITILTALVLIACTIILTMLSMHNAASLYLPFDAGYEIVDEYPKYDPLLSDEPLPEPLQLAKQQFDEKSILYCCLFTVLGTIAVYFVTGQALRPLRSLSNMVDTIDEHNLSLRLPAAASNDEISRLTDGFNCMLSRLDDAFLRQKRFTANAAHELKTPLAIMKTGIQVLDEDDHATLADYHTQNMEALKSADRLAAIVDDLLLLASAGETGAEGLEDVLLEPLFDAIRHELAPRLKEREMTCHVDCGELSVAGNVAFLYRAFFNLMDNACKYGNKGGNIWIKAVVETDGTEVLFWDDGPGIAEKHLPYIFDAFYRVDKSRSRAMGGSGLGLSIVKAMVEACKGTISVQSDGKKGTCFLVKFPVLIQPIQ